MAPSVAVQRFAAQVLEGAMVLQALAAEEHREAARPAAPAVATSALLDALFRFREDHRLTKVALTRLIGVTVKTYQSWEHGRHRPQAHLIPRIVAVLETPLGTGLPRRSTNNTLRQGILALLHTMPYQQAWYKDLAARLEKGEKQVHKKCQDLVQAGQLAYIAPGLFALPQEREPAPAPSVPPHATLADAIVAALRTMPHQQAYCGVLAVFLGKPYKSVHIRCQALVQTRQLDRVAPGTYALAGRSA